MTILLSIVTFLVMFCTLVAVHEWGHYLAARWMKMGVDEFAIGFGKVLKTWKRKTFTIADDTHETVFNLRAIPLGGFVRITGMEPKEDGSEVNIPHGFYAKPPWARIIALLAGPLFSLIFGVLVLFAVFATSGRPTVTTLVGGILEKSAAVGHIKPGDRISSVNGVPVKERFEATKIIREGGISPVTLGVLRDSQTITVTLTPKISSEPIDILDSEGLPSGDKAKLPMVGIAFAVEDMQLAPGAAFLAAVNEPISGARRLISRFNRPAQILEESTGMIGIAAVTHSAVQEGTSTVVYICGMLSVALGIMNLLPIGMLDGGQIFLALVEMLNRNRRLSFKLQSAYLTVGIAVMALAFILITRQDIIRFVLPK